MTKHRHLAQTLFWEVLLQRLAAALLQTATAHTTALKEMADLVLAALVTHLLRLDSPVLEPRVKETQAALLAMTLLITPAAAAAEQVPQVETLFQTHRLGMEALVLLGSMALLTQVAVAVAFMAPHLFHLGVQAGAVQVAGMGQLRAETEQPIAAVVAAALAVEAAAVLLRRAVQVAPA
jgi:hypothetical protein